MASMNSSNELTLESLFTALQYGTSPIQNKVKFASDTLQIWQTQPKYHRLLQQIVSSSSLPFDTRWLAAIQLKNGIDRFWRKTAMNAISAEEKAEIRSRCIEVGMNEPDRRLALQNALFVAKIVRIDYPHDWPAAVRDVLGAVQASTKPGAPRVQLSASLHLLLVVVKELSTAMLMRTRRSFYGDGPSILQTVKTVYLTVFQCWYCSFEQGRSNEACNIDDMEDCLVCLRILRRLLVSAFEDPSREGHVREFWATLSTNFEALIAVLHYKTQSASSDMLQLIQRMILQLAKLHLGMVETHPSCFAQLPNAIMIARLHWDMIRNFGAKFGATTVVIHQEDDRSVKEDDEGFPFDEKLSLKGLLLLRACVKMVYNPALTIKYQTAEDNSEKSLSKQAIKENLLADDLVLQMMEIIVTKFFVFRQADLQRWANDPSEWEKSEEGEGDSWKYSVRVCAEKLFLDLVLNHKGLLIQPLLDVFRRFATTDNRDILLKDSIYSAIGLSAPILVNQLDFNGFMISTLLPELQAEENGYGILRRRASKIIAQWAAVGGLDSAIVYQIFQYLLDDNQLLNDIVVRLTAGRQLKFALDPYAISVDSLVPYASVLVDRMMKLIQEAELVETKIALLGTVQALVQSLGQAVDPFADMILTALPVIWEGAQEEYLLKQTIIGLLSEIFKNMRSTSSRFHPLILPLIASALDPHNTARTYLLDDTVDLWAAVLTQAPDFSKDILGLWPNLLPLFETADENLRRALEIADSYMLLAPNEIVAEGSLSMWQALNSLLKQPLRRDARVSICELAERLLVVSEQIGGATTFLKVVSTAEETGFMSQLLTGLRSAFVSHQNPSPKAPKTEVNGIIETQYWRVVARILLVQPARLLTLIKNLSPESKLVDDDRFLADFLTEMFSHYDDLSSADTSKLIALSLASLVTSANDALAHVLAQRLQDFITVWTAAIHECTYEGKDNLVWADPEDLVSLDGEDPEQRRRRKLESGDPVRTQNTRDVVASAIQIWASRLGADFQELLSSVDANVVEQFKALHLF